MSSLLLLGVVVTDVAIATFIVQTVPAVKASIPRMITDSFFIAIELVKMPRKSVGI